MTEQIIQKTIQYIKEDIESLNSEFNQTDAIISNKDLMNCVYNEESSLETLNTLRDVIEVLNKVKNHKQL